MKLISCTSNVMAQFVSERLPSFQPLVDYLPSWACFRSGITISRPPASPFIPPLSAHSATPPCNKIHFVSSPHSYDWTMIHDLDLRRQAAAILARRHIFGARLLELLDIAENAGGLDEANATEFTLEAANIFRWRPYAVVPAEVYRRFYAAHPLFADIVCFSNPHINHLTLPALDIDAAQNAMGLHPDITPKAIIEGPPRRRCPILLRQTSFKAVQEPVVFEAHETGLHAARFGEVEQPGAALTRKGRALYDRLLAEVGSSTPPSADGSNPAAYVYELQRCFSAFPDNNDSLRTEGLAFFRYAPTPKAASQLGRLTPPFSIDTLVREGYIGAETITYEDFLPVSAAGIFRSNLASAGGATFGEGADRQAFENALGATILDDFALYERAENASLAATLNSLGVKTMIDKG